ncbi:hypothetical protein AGR4B_Lc70152 [Agrobacterium tumefaciens str. CFBP 5621]|uniref:restriction endonuclease subunit S n=1 Tax=Agrobacterium tumefaciens TaxID=358 RepID=UPI0009CA7A0A|nr:restriction endonuclease subunit S [Agrobacterium tumefaciens]CUX50657.1 hypothetical protein AGR4B_Lc70152 [Agrobacterium tumefaciens str. CFBP 5621]
MSALPRGWAYASLGAVIELKYGKSLPKGDRKEGPHNVFGSNGIVGTNQSSLSSAPAIIVGRKGSFGEVTYSAEKCFPIDTTYYVDEFDVVEPHFCYSLLKHLPLKSLNRATAIPGLNREDAYGLTFALPPLAEQKRIVVKLDALNAKSARARSELARIETLVSRCKQAVLSKAFSGELTRDWRRVASTTWPWRSEFWGDCGETLNGRAFPSGDYCDSGVRLLRPGNLGASGDVFWNEKNSRFLPEKYAVEFPKHFIRGEAILINLTAQSLEDQFLARACLSSASDEFMLNQRIGLFRPRNMMPKFCLFALKSPRFRSFVDNGMNSGSLIQHVHTKQLEQYKFDVPDIEEQHEIVRRIESAFAKIDRLAKEAKRALELLGKLDEAILAKAFRGELVPQDENDEPAVRLLARIRAEREAAPKGKRGRGRNI